MSYTPDHFTNNAQSTVAGGAGGAGTSFGSTDTTLLLATGDGAKFPSVGPFRVQFGVTVGSLEYALCYSRSGDTLTFTGTLNGVSGNGRGIEGTTATTWVVGTSVQHVVTAGNFDDIWIFLENLSFNVMAYGAKGDGVTDDTAAIQRAINAAQVAGGEVFFPAGTFLISSTLTISTGGISIRGSGWGGPTGGGGVAYGTIIKIANSTNIYAFTFTPPGGVRLDGIRISNLKIDCNGTNQTTGGGGVNAFGAAYCLFDRLWIEVPCQDGIYLNSDNLGGFGHHHVIRACWFHGGTSSPVAGGGRAIAMHQSDETIVAHCIIEQCGTAGGTFNGAAIYDDAGLQQIVNCVFVANPLVNNVNCIKIAANNGDNVIGCTFDGGTFAQIALLGAGVTSGCIIKGNRFYEPINAQPGIYVGNGGVNTIEGNIFVSHPTNNFSSAAVDGSGTSVASIISGNAFVQQGTWSSGGPLVSPGNHIVRNNSGYNPVGHLSAPAIPASGVSQANTFGVDATVYVTGGTVSAIAIGGVATGLTGGTFRLAPGQTITLTYTVAPTWTWFGD